MSPTAEITTRHEEPAAVAAALRPDNTDEMATTVSGETVETRITRETVAGLASTVDDYVVNLQVAAAIDRASEPNDVPTTNTEQSQ